MPDSTLLTPEIVWGLMPRAVGLLYAVSFLSLARQVVPLVGRRGIAPLGDRLQRMAEDYPGARRFFDRPTVFWLCHRDGFLRAVPLIGLAGAVLAIHGGEFGPAGLLLAWVCLLSLDVCSLWLPWDTLLFEAGFLALFLPAVPALPTLATAALPLPAVTFLFRWLVIRLMLGFAKLKFIGTERGDGLYLQGFLTWLPLPTPLGWYLQHAPRGVLRLACGFMWLAEVVAPILAFFAGTPRLVGAALLMLLTLGIGATGNWGHFNLGYLLLCLCLLDTSASGLDVLAPLSGWHEILTTAAMGFLFLLTLVFFPLNSWVTQAWTQWNHELVMARRPWLRAGMALLRLLNPFRLVGSYGVFPPNSSPPLKMVPVLEGSHDGEHWKPYPYAFMPTGPTSAPRFVAPHHPRIDHSCIYVGLGLHESDSVGGAMFELKPYGASPYSHHGWMHRLVQRVLEGEKTVLRLLGPDPFPDAPPRLVRVVHQCLTPTTLAERRRTGRWWHARTMSVIFPPSGRDASVWSQWIPPPECLHPDLLHWRRRSPALQAMLRAAREGQPLREAVRVQSDLTADEVRTFWTRFVPFVADPDRRDRWDRLSETAAEVAEHFGSANLLRLERIQQRLVYLLQQPLEAHVFGRAEPRLDVPSYFHLQVALQALLFDGEAAVESFGRAPELAIARVRALQAPALLYPTAIFRWEMVRFVILTLRARVRLSRAPDMPFGIGHFKDFLLTQDVAPQWFPDCTRESDGYWAVRTGDFACNR